MNQELQNKVITVSAKEEKLQGGKPVMKIKDEQNLTYTVYKTKQDGTTSIAWGQIPDIGNTVQIGFVEQPGEYEGKAITYRTIRTFNKDVAQGVQTPRQERFSNPLYNKPKTEVNWDQLGYEKTLSLWCGHFISNPMFKGTDFLEKQISNGTFWKLFQAIKADGKKRFFEFSGTVEFKGQPQEVQTADLRNQELPTIQVQEDTSEWDKTYGNLSEDELPPF